MGIAICIDKCLKIEICWHVLNSVLKVIVSANGLLNRSFKVSHNSHEVFLSRSKFYKEVGFLWRFLECSNHVITDLNVDIERIAVVRNWKICSPLQLWISVSLGMISSTLCCSFNMMNKTDCDHIGKYEEVNVILIVYHTYLFTSQLRRFWFRLLFILLTLSPS